MTTWQRGCSTLACSVLYQLHGTPVYGPSSYDTSLRHTCLQCIKYMTCLSTTHRYTVHSCLRRRMLVPKGHCTAGTNIFFGFFVSVQPACHVAMPQSNQPISLLATWLCFHYRMSPFVNSANHFAALRKSACGPAIPRTFVFRPEVSSVRFHILSLLELPSTSSATFFFISYLLLLQLPSSFLPPFLIRHECKQHVTVTGKRWNH